MKKGYTDIIVVMDRSGSMGAIVNDTIGGFNTFLKEQKELKGEATLTLVQFDTDYQVVCDNLPLSEVKDLTSTTFVPRGNTALYDAVCKAINSVGGRYSNTFEDARPEKIVFVIITDGEENSSKEFTYEQMKEKIQHQTEKYGWQFVFLAANQDACKVGNSYGISGQSCLSYQHNSRGATAMFASVSHNLTSYRTGVTKSVTFSEADRDAQEVS